MNNLGKNIFDLANFNSFPPYEIVQKDDENFMIHICVAGYKKGNLDIKLDRNILTVKGKPRLRTENNMRVIEGSIKRSKFTRSFSLKENVKVLSSELKDGILTINLNKIIPEEDKPKNIEIW